MGNTRKSALYRRRNLKLPLPQRPCRFTAAHQDYFSMQITDRLRKKSIARAFWKLSQMNGYESVQSSKFAAHKCGLGSIWLGPLCSSFVCQPPRWLNGKERNRVAVIISVPFRWLHYVHLEEFCRCSVHFVRLCGTDSLHKLFYEALKFKENLLFFVAFVCKNCFCCD